MKSCSGEYTASRKICQPLVEKVIGQSMSYPFEVLEAQYMARAEVRQSRRQQQSDEYEKLLTSVPNSLHKPLKLAQEKGALDCIAPGVWFQSTQVCIQGCYCAEVQLEP